jgi:hypothetical protein
MNPLLKVSNGFKNGQQVWNANYIKSINIVNTPPIDGQVIIYDENINAFKYGGIEGTVPDGNCNGDYLYWDSVLGDWVLGSTIVKIGCNSGMNHSGTNYVAIGYNAGNNGQGSNTIAIGNAAGFTGQGDSAVGIGFQAGNNNQGTNSVSIGFQAGQNTQGINAVAIGVNAGNQNQMTNCIAIGVDAGQSNQGFNSDPVLNGNAIAIG